MIKKVFVLLCFILLANVVLADGWGDISTGQNVSLTQDDAVEVTEGDSTETYSSGEYGVAKTKYTMNFYIAVGIGTFTILLVLYMVYLFIRGPSVKWKKSKPLKQ